MPRSFIERTAPFFLAATLTACAGVTPPPGQETRTEFTQESATPYRDAYRVVAKMMRSCHRVIGLLGNGYEVMSDLDSEAGQGTVELYHVGLTGASTPEDSIYSRTVTIRENGAGSTITTTGTTPKHVYGTHLDVTAWLDGNLACAAGRR